jgi:hypothetical protein
MPFSRDVLAATFFKRVTFFADFGVSCIIIIITDRHRIMELWPTDKNYAWHQKFLPC